MFDKLKLSSGRSFTVILFERRIVGSVKRLERGKLGAMMGENRSAGKNMGNRKENRKRSHP